MPEPDNASLGLWAHYARHRYDEAAARVTEARSWARHLVSAVGVIVALEANLLSRLTFDASPPESVIVRNLSLAIITVALFLQLRVLWQVLELGYRGRIVRGPESPTVLAPLLTDDATETTRVLGAYFAKAHDAFFALSEDLFTELTRITSHFRWTLVLVVIALGQITAVSLYQGFGRDSHVGLMSSKPDPSKRPGHEPVKSPTSPDAPPIINTKTPTEGLPGHRLKGPVDGFDDADKEP